MSTIKAIRKKCLDCSCGSTKSVKYCTATDCNLWLYRFGIMPKTVRKKIGTQFLEPSEMPSSDISLDDLP